MIFIFTYCHYYNFRCCLSLVFPIPSIYNHFSTWVSSTYTCSQDTLPEGERRSSVWPTSAAILATGTPSGRSALHRSGLSRLRSYSSTTGYCWMVRELVRAQPCQRHANRSRWNLKVLDLIKRVEELNKSAKRVCIYYKNKYVIIAS